MKRSFKKPSLCSLRSQNSGMQHTATAVVTTIKSKEEYAVTDIKVSMQLHLNKMSVI